MKYTCRQHFKFCSKDPFLSLGGYKTSWEMKKIEVTSTFSISHNVFKSLKCGCLIKGPYSSESSGSFRKYLYFLFQISSLFRENQSMVTDKYYNSYDTSLTPSQTANFKLFQTE